MFFHSAAAFSQSEIDTTWNGAIDIMGTKLGFAVKFTTTGSDLKAVMDIPEQGAMGIELDKVSFKNPKVHFELPAESRTAVFDGLYYGDSIGGTFSQSGINGRFQLTRGELKDLTTPDTTEKTFNSEEVTFYNDGNTFAGTITYPKKEGKFPAVVLITGSGAQNRDEDIFGFKIFKIIAEYLSNNGIAVLRYDDRGVGGSKGKTVNESTTMDFAGDVGAAIDLLKTKDYIFAGSIGLLGHSEGGIVAPIVAAQRDDVAYIILMAGTGVKGIDIIKEQSKLIMKAENATDDEITGYVMAMDLIYANIVKNGDVKELKKQLAQNVEDSFDKMSAEEKKAIKDKDEYVKKTVDEAVSQFSSKWMKYFLSYDPAKALEKVTVPVLMLFGGKDLQVPVSQNRQPMEDALKKAGNQEYLVKVFPDANHLFQEAGTGSPNEYPQLPKAFVPGFLEEILDWIRVKTQ
ncbi:MAG: alpha/beta fold hydrolase [Ignavibacteria bacterium]|nr:alpha/beta fold hydrolase [Ignavibacteria bacterium]